MGTRIRCRSCGDAFVPDQTVYCGDSFCSSCRIVPAEDVVAAEKESYQQYRKMGYSDEQAGNKAHDFACQVARERGRRGK
jgi:hypothetical protein